jgi:TolA-binding protein
VDRLDLLQEHSEHLDLSDGVATWKPGNPLGHDPHETAFWFRDVDGQGNPLQMPGGTGGMLKTMTGVGAAASVLNLAVTAVGFYYMNEKLNGLRDQLEGLSEQVDELQTTVEAGFQQMERRLIQVQYLVEALHKGQEELLEGQEDIKDQLDASEFAKLQSVIDFMREYEESGRELSGSRVEDFRDKLADVRNRSQILIEKWCRGDKAVHSRGFARGTGYFQVWALAVAVEARVLRHAGRTEAASAQIQRQLEDWYYEAAGDAVSLLLGDRHGICLSGAFEDRVQPEHYLRMLEFSEGHWFDQTDAELAIQKASQQQKDFFGHTPSERAEKLLAYEPAPDYSRTVQAHQLVSLGHRLDTMALEYDFCAKQGFDVSDWERRQFGAPDNEHVIAIPVEQAA